MYFSQIPDAEFDALRRGAFPPDVHTAATSGVSATSSVSAADEVVPAEVNQPVGNVVQSAEPEPESAR